MTEGQMTLLPIHEVQVLKLFNHSLVTKIGSLDLFKARQRQQQQQHRAAGGRRSLLLSATVTNTDKLS
jgi:hypothetical protein